MLHDCWAVVNNEEGNAKRQEGCWKIRCFTDLGERRLIQACGWGGNLTTVNQKPSMVFTTLRNPSRFTGLVM
jgi:hypothetical protein